MDKFIIIFSFSALYTKKESVARGGSGGAGGGGGGGAPAGGARGGGGGGGGGIHPPYGKYTSEFLSPILFYTVNYTYIRSSDPKGFFPSFKTLNLAVDQSSAAKSTYASNFRKSKIYKGKSTADFFGGPPKINRGT